MDLSSEFSKLEAGSQSQSECSSVRDLSDILDLSEFDFDDEDTWLYEPDSKSDANYKEWLYEDTDTFEGIPRALSSSHTFRLKSFDTRTFTRPKKKISRPSIEQYEQLYSSGNSDREEGVSTEVSKNLTKSFTRKLSENAFEEEAEKSPQHSLIEPEIKPHINRKPLHFDLSQPVAIHNFDSFMINSAELDSFQNMSPPSLVNSMCSSTFANLMENSFIKNDPILREIRDTDFTGSALLQDTEAPMFQSITESCSSLNSDTPESFLKRVSRSNNNSFRKNASHSNSITLVQDSVISVQDSIISVQDSSQEDGHSQVRVNGNGTFEIVDDSSKSASFSENFNSTYPLAHPQSDTFCKEPTTENVTRDLENISLHETRNNSQTVSPNVKDSQNVSPNVIDSQKASSRVREGQNGSFNVRDSLNVCPNVRDSQNVSPNVRDSQKVSSRVRDGQNVSPNVRDSQNVSPNVRDTQNVTHNIVDCENMSPNVNGTYRRTPKLQHNGTFRKADLKNNRLSLNLTFQRNKEGSLDKSSSKSIEKDLSIGSNENISINRTKAKVILDNSSIEDMKKRYSTAEVPDLNRLSYCLEETANKRNALYKEQLDLDQTVDFKRSSLGSADSLDRMSSLSGSSKGSMRGSNKMLNMADIDAIVAMQERSLDQAMSTPKPNSRVTKTMWENSFISPIVSNAKEHVCSDSELSSDDYKSVRSNHSSKVSLESLKHPAKSLSNLAGPAVHNIKLKTMTRGVYPMSSNIRGSYTNLKTVTNSNMGGSHSNLYRPPNPMRPPSQTNLRTMGVKLKGSYTSLKPIIGANLPVVAAPPVVNNMNSTLNLSRATNPNVTQLVAEPAKSEVRPREKATAENTFVKPQQPKAASGLPRPTGIPRPASRIPGPRTSNLRPTSTRSSNNY